MRCSRNRIGGGIDQVTAALATALDFFFDFDFLVFFGWELRSIAIGLTCRTLRGSSVLLLQLACDLVALAPGGIVQRRLFLLWASIAISFVGFPR